jgi:hypothetical protein
MSKGRKRDGMNHWKSLGAVCGMSLLILLSWGCGAPESAPASTPTPVPTPMATLPTPDTEIQLDNHFEGGGVSFNYPKDWVSWGKTNLDQMRSYLKSQMGADLITMLKTRDEACVLQIAKQRNTSSFSSFYQGKKEIADQVSTEGMKVMGYRYTKYSVEVVELPGNQKAVLGYAEREDGQTGVSYQFLSDGYEYNVNFIYKSATRATNDEKIRGQIMRTFKLISMKD